jgi:DNA-binding response OmpR family regulator
VRLLLIGRHKLLLKALKQGLQEEGFTVVVADDAPLLSPELPPSDYDAILLDVLRPEDAGLALVRCWRRAGLKAPVLALTPSGVAEGAPGLQSAADDVLSKPFELAELLARLRTLIGGKGPPGASAPLRLNGLARLGRPEFQDPRRA